MTGNNSILLIDPDQSLLADHAKRLEDEGYSVAIAATGKEARDRLAQDSFDLVLLETDLPDIGGEELMEYITDSKAGSATVILSEETSFEKVTRAFHLGAFDYLSKPCSFEQLHLALRNAIRKQEVDRSLNNLRKQLERSERLHRFMIESSPDIIFIVDKNGHFAYVNDRAEELLNYKKDELIGEHYSTIVDPEFHERASHCFNERRSGPRATRDAELWLACKSGSRPGWGRSRIAIEMNSIGVYDNETRDENGVVDKGEYSGTYVVARDITERLASEKLIHFQAYHDLLTGLPNRAMFHDRLANAISNARRERDKLAVMFLDLDRFKIVNDNLGHAIGDELLKQVANRLKSSLREGDTIARLGGDEFIILLPNVESSHVASVVANKLVKAIKGPFNVEGNELYVTGSIGVAMYPVDGDTADTLIKNSDIAMYYTKEKGKNSHNLYSSDMSVRQSRMLNMEADMLKGMKQNQFEVFYQPQVSLYDGNITGVEALLRWEHPEKGLLTPSFFMNVAEESGIIVELGDWVLDTAIAEARQWRDAGMGVEKLAVNFSSKQIEQTDFVDKIIQTLRKHNFPGQNLEIEITESMLMSNIDSTRKKLGELSRVGVHVAIDDFGTGYSSLSLLQKLPIHRLKIDRSFIREIQEDAGQSIIEAIAYLARGLKIDMVAEGVEEEFQLRYLRGLDCPVVQGHLYSQAVPPEEARQLLEDDRAIRRRDQAGPKVLNSHPKSRVANS